VETWLLVQLLVQAENAPESNLNGFKWLGVLESCPKNGHCASCFCVLHQPKDKEFQLVSDAWRFCCAPMIDWTYPIFSVVFPQ
jgi:hypothetical protein